MRIKSKNSDVPATFNHTLPHGPMRAHPEAVDAKCAAYAISSPRIVPVAEANLSVSSPMRCSIETNRFGSG